MSKLKGCEHGRTVKYCSECKLEKRVQELEKERDELLDVIDNISHLANMQLAASGRLVDD